MTVSDCGDLQQRFVSGEYARWRPSSSIHDNEDAKNGSLSESLGRFLFKSTLSDITIVVSGRNTRYGETQAAAACAGGRKVKRNRPPSGVTAQQVGEEMRSRHPTQTRKGVISARQLFAAHLTTYSLLLHTGQRTTKRSEQPSDASSVTSESSFGSSSEWCSERVSKEASESVGIEIPAHSFVLAVRSPVFLSMLEANMLEAASRRIVVDGYSEDTVREFLTFLYTDQCPSLSTDGDEYEEDREEPTIDRLQDLMELAHKYDVCRLFSLTETVLLERLARENVEQLLLFAHRFDASRLREQSLQFIVDHRDTLPVPRHILSDPELACELYSLMSRVY